MLSKINQVHTVLFQTPLGSLDCTRKSYIPPCRGKFALSESTVSKFGKIFIFPLYYLIRFSHSFFEILKFHKEKQYIKEHNISFYHCTTKRNNGHSNGWTHWIKIIRSHYVYQLVYFALCSNRRKLPNELAKQVCTEHIVALYLVQR